MVYHQDVSRGEEGANKHVKVSPVERRGFVDAKQIHPAKRRESAAPYCRMNFSAEKQTEHRHNHDIKRRDETGLSDGGVNHPNLLNIREQKQYDPAGYPAFEREIVELRHGGRGAVVFFIREQAGHENDGQKRGASQEIPGRRKSGRPRVIHANTLRDIRHAPNKRGHYEHRGSNYLSFHRGAPISFAVSPTIQ